MTYTEYSALLYFFDEGYIYEKWDSRLVFWILYEPRIRRRPVGVPAVDSSK